MALLLVGLLALSVGFTGLKVKEETVVVYGVGIVASHTASCCTVLLLSAAVSILLKMSNKLESRGSWCPRFDNSVTASGFLNLVPNFW